ncbi:MAG: hypothetical protein ACYTGH_15545 [Planctomycetota bacterium]|jgi:hypothetical protein
MNFYDFEQIKSGANCLEIARELGLDVNSDGRCAATWRGGTNQSSVMVKEDGWHDFSDETGGSVIDLVAQVKHGGDIQAAQEELGQRLGLQPTRTVNWADLPDSPSASRYDSLISEGWAEVARYAYQDAAGAPILDVVRLEKDGKKTFLQWNAVTKRWGVRDVEPPLYNLPDILGSTWAVIVEGEKDADRLIGMGIPATTCAGGAKKWRDEYVGVLAGKDIVILPDNDEPGQAHATMIAEALLPVCTSVRIVYTSDKPKGDVSNFLDEGGSYATLFALIQNTPPVTQDISEEAMIAKAKAANQSPMRNYREVWETSADGSKKKVKKPRTTGEMVTDVHDRFLGFPCKVGEQLFDHDRDSGEIRYIRKSNQLSAWVALKSGHNPAFARGDDFTTREELLSGLQIQARRYEAISTVPDHPVRDDVFYHHPTLPPPSPNGECLDELVGFFNAADHINRAMVKAYICAPLFYDPSVPRPMWIIDSDKRGSGKTYLANATARLYGAPAITLHRASLRSDMKEISKRLVSVSARQARIVLFDNVAGKFASEELAQLVTAPYITGRPTYGEGEEFRPNNLTWTVTTNGATVDDDLAVRAYFIMLHRVAEYVPGWDERLNHFIDENRYQIIADIAEMLDTHSPFEGIELHSRFSTWDSRILQPACGSSSAYCDAVKAQMQVRGAANSDMESGRDLEDEFRFQIQELDIDPDTCVFIRSAIAKKWLRDKFSETKRPESLARNLVRDGHCPEIDPKVEIYPHNGKDRRRGFLWIGKSDIKRPIYTITERGGKAIKIFHQGELEI